MSKRIICLMLAAVMALSLAGCKESAEVDSTAEPTNAAPGPNITQAPYLEEVPDWDTEAILPEYEEAYDVSYLYEGKEVYDKFVRLETAQRIVGDPEKGNTELYIPYTTIPVGYIIDIPVIIDGLHTEIYVWRYQEDATYFTLDLCPRMGDFSRTTAGPTHYPTKIVDGGMEFKCIFDDEPVVWANQIVIDEDGEMQPQWYPEEESLLMEYCRPMEIAFGEFWKQRAAYCDIPVFCYPWMIAGQEYTDWNGIPCTTLADISHDDAVVMDYELLSSMVWYVYSVQEELSAAIMEAIGDNPQEGISSAGGPSVASQSVVDNDAAPTSSPAGYEG